MSNKLAIEQIILDLTSDEAKKLENYCEQTGKAETDVIRELIRGLPAIRLFRPSLRSQSGRGLYLKYTMLGSSKGFCIKGYVMAAYRNENATDCDSNRGIPNPKTL